MKAAETTVRAIARLPRPVALAACVAVLIVNLGALAYGAFGNPIQNFDMLGYAGAILDHFEDDPAAIHDEAYGALEAYIGDTRDWRAITGASRYREDMAADPEIFYSIIPFYQVKPLFNLATWIVSAFANLTFSTILVSWIAVTAFTLGFFVFAASERAYGLFLLSWPMFIGAGVLDIARTGTPDGLAFALAAGGALGLMAERRTLGWTLLALSTLARPDNLLLVLAAAAVFALRGDAGTRLRAGLAVVASIAVYVLVTRAYGHYGYWPHFMLTFHNEVGMDMRAFAEPYDPTTHVLTVFEGVKHLFIQSYFGLFVVATVLLALLWADPRREGLTTADKIAIAAVLFFLARFALFPLHQIRFGALPTFLVLLALAASVLAMLPRPAAEPVATPEPDADEPPGPDTEPGEGAPPADDGLSPRPARDPA